MMIKPVSFRYNQETAVNNFYQKVLDNISFTQIQNKALNEFNNFVKKFLNKKNEMEDAAGYHKSLFTAMNPDAIANHFYEQGKADAMKQSIANTKNISMDPRKTQSAAPQQGTTYRSVSADGKEFTWGFKKRK